MTKPPTSCNKAEWPKRLARLLAIGTVVLAPPPGFSQIYTEKNYEKIEARSPEAAIVRKAANSRTEGAFAPRNMMEDDLGKRAKIRKAQNLAWYPAEIDVSIRPGWFHHAAEDTQDDTCWTTTGRDTTAVLDFTFTSPQNFNVLQLRENIGVGQRIEQFVLESKRGKEWKTVVAGTTVGDKRILKFEPLQAQYLRITASRLNPTLSAIVLYKQAELPGTK